MFPVRQLVNIGRALVTTVALVGLLAQGIEGDWRGCVKMLAVLAIIILSHLRDQIPEEEAE